MALDNLDPNIALQAGQIPADFQQGYLGNQQQLNALLAMQMRAQQLRQVQQSENALRNLYGNPQNLDSSGRPTTNALNQLMAQSPEAGLQIQNQLAQMDERRLRGQVLHGEVTKQQREAGYGVLKTGLNAYEDALKSNGGNQQQAVQAAQAAASTAADEAVAGGSMTPDYRKRISTFDPVKWRAMAGGYEAQYTKPMTAAERGHLGLEGQRLDLEKGRFGLDLAKSTRGEFSEPKNVEAVGSDGQKVQTTGVYDKQAGRWLTSDRTQPLNVTRELSTSAKGEFSPSKEIGVLDKDGNVVWRGAARESTQGPGWIQSDTGKPVEVPSGGHIDVGQAAGVVMGSREAQMLQRQLGSGVQALAALKDIVSLPSGASMGSFAGRGQEKGLFNAAKETMTNKLTSQDVQSYNAIIPGVTRALAFIDSQGLAPGQNFTESFNAEMLKEGDSIQTKMLKLARQREIVDAGMETLLTNPRLAAEQKKKAEAVRDGVRTAIPWTPIDVINLMRSNNPKATLRDVAAKEGLAPKEGAPSEAVPEPKKGEGPPIEMFGGAEGRKIRNDETGEIWQLHGGKVVKQ